MIYKWQSCVKFALTAFVGIVLYTHAADASQDAGKDCTPHQGVPEYDIAKRQNAYIQRMSEAGSVAGDLVRGIRKLAQALGEEGYQKINLLHGKRNVLLAYFKVFFELSIPWSDRSFEMLKHTLDDPSGTEIFEPYFVKGKVLDIGSGLGNYWHDLRQELDPKGVIKDLSGIDPHVFPESAKKGPWRHFLPIDFLSLLYSSKIHQFSKKYDAAVSVYYLNYLILQASGRHGDFNEFCATIRNSLGELEKIYFDALLHHFVLESIDELKVSLYGAVSMLKTGGTLYVGPIPNSPDVRHIIAYVTKDISHSKKVVNRAIRNRFGSLTYEVELRPFIRTESVEDLRKYHTFTSPERLADDHNGTLSDDGTEIMLTDLHLIITRNP